MKQVKLLMVALTLLMGMSFTSCLKGDDDTTYTDLAIAKCSDYFPPTFTLQNGQKLVIEDASLSTVTPGNIYMFYYQFDRAVQPVNSPSITVTLPNGAPVSISAKLNEGPQSSAVVANAPLYTLTGTVYNYGQVSPMLLYSNEFLFVPTFYWIKNETDASKLKEELEKHAFIITYDTETMASSEPLLLTINHVISDNTEETVARDRYTYEYKAYNLSYAVAAYTAKTGASPTKIKVQAMTNASKNSLDGALLQTADLPLAK